MNKDTIDYVLPIAALGGVEGVGTLNLHDTLDIAIKLVLMFIAVVKPATKLRIYLRKQFQKVLK